MESINRSAMIEAVYPVLLRAKQQSLLSPRAQRDTIAALADGYSFSTNLGSDPPIGGMAPQTAQQMLATALEEGWPWEQLKAALSAYAERRRA